jgi:hypothetical protein
VGPTSAHFLGPLESGRMQIFGAPLESVPQPMSSVGDKKKRGQPPKMRDRGWIGVRARVAIK